MFEYLSFINGSKFSLRYNFTLIDILCRYSNATFVPQMSKQLSIMMNNDSNQTLMNLSTLN